MKVKELIEKLSEVDPEKEVTYECQYIDYVSEHPNHVNLGGLHIYNYQNSETIN